MKTLQTRTIDCSQLRAEGDEGIIEGYFAVWDTVDSYKSTFQRGAFSKTLNERGSKVKILFNHNGDEVIGVPLEIKEDDHGAYIRAQLNMDVQRARETFSNIKLKALDAFSFGFRTVKNHFDHGVEVITEVMLAEVSPVVFEANEAAMITGARSTDFDETLDSATFWDRKNQIIQAFWRTLDDQYWDLLYEEEIAAAAVAIDQFKVAYIAWLQEAADVNMERSAPNELSKRMGEYLSEKGGIDEVAKTSSLTVDELRTLRAGKPVAVQTPLDCLPDEIRAANLSERSKAVEALCDEMRAGVLPAEAMRMTNLLSKSLPVSKEADADDAVDFLRDFRNQLKG